MSFQDFGWALFEVGCFRNFPLFKKRRNDFIGPFPINQPKESFAGDCRVKRVYSKIAANYRRRPMHFQWLNLTEECQNRAIFD